MGFGFGNLLKIARGGMGPDDLAEILDAAGIKIAPVEIGQSVFTSLARAASLPRAKMVRFYGKTEDGAIIEALMVVNSITSGSVDDHSEVKAIL